jgi:hypothetical protein
MSDQALMWTEISFNVIYLAVVWWLVALMFVRRHTVAPENRRVAGLVNGAFALLALGDTGHVGFRVVGYALGDLETPLALLGMKPTLVGLGALATAITVTFFYVLMLMAWRARFGQAYGWFGILLFAAAAVRLVLMALPQNEWGRAVPLQPWSTIRNIPLMVQGLGLAFLILRDALAARDRAFTGVGISILVSYACYMPVIFFVQRVPALGMLMIPKTMAYVAIAIIAYRALYRAAPVEQPRLQAA